MTTSSKHRDDESGLDFFEARYFSSRQGRFTSPDEFTGGPQGLFILGGGDPESQALPYADITEPATLNKYQYCLNNPLRYIDPDGHQHQTASEEENKKKRAAQGAAIYEGAAATKDGVLRKEYAEKSKTATSAERKALKADTRQKMTPLGQSLSKVADMSRKNLDNKLEAKTATEAAASATKTSKTWNRIGMATEGAGKVLLVAGVAVSAYNISTAKDKGEAVSREVGAWGGALTVGAVGAKGGAVAGFALGGPPGAAIGAVVGGIGGGIIGGIGGSEVGSKIYHWIKD